MNGENFRILSEAIDRRAARPAAEQFAEMVARGAIDREGHVILRRPAEDRLVSENGSSHADSDRPSAT
jgi:hypothetical protein